MSEKLRPCPFCGKEPINDGLFKTTNCDNCDITLFVEDWNTRPIEDEQAKLIEELGNALINEFGNGEHGYAFEIEKYKQWKDKRCAKPLPNI